MVVVSVAVAMVMFGEGDLIGVIVVAVDRLTVGIGWARLILDAAVYLVVVVGSGALRAGEIAGVVKEALRGRARLGASPAPVTLGRGDA